MGTITVRSVDETWVEGNKVHTRGRLSLSTSYAANGDTFPTARNLGLGTVDTLRIWPAAGYEFDVRSSASVVAAFTFRPGAESIGQSLVLSSIANATGGNAAFAAWPMFSSATVGTVVRGTPLGNLQANLTSAADWVSTLSTSLTTVSLSVHHNSANTGFQIYSTTGATGTLFTTAAAGTQTMFIPVSDGGLLPISTDTTAQLAVYASDSNATGLRLRTSATISISVALSQTLSLSLPTTYNRLTEVSAATNLSTTTARYEAMGS